MRKDPPLYCTAGPVNKSNMFIWEAQIIGPPSTPYHGGVFKLQITFPSDYPDSPPRLQFITVPLHLNISSSGTICNSLLTRWHSNLSIGIRLYFKFKTYSHIIENIQQVVIRQKM